ncbi:peptidase S15 [Tricladium varicosporioides]|nr:peptidase S15 [Hymenoscyphus varicosporioides]
MIIQRDVAITVGDGNILRADIFRPADEKPAPVIMTLGPYGKGVRYMDGFAPQWKWMVDTYPSILPGSTREYMVWETVDPEIWVKWGYVCIRVDSRGAGRSPGFLDILSPQETKDYYEAIEWAGTQTWCNGKVGLNGISYYAINQWLVAALQPPHLSAMIPWEGAGDFYRDFARHGGIACNGFVEVWYPRQVVSVQHGNPTAHLDVWLNESSTGPKALPPDTLIANRREPLQDILDHPLVDDFHRERSPDWSRITVPFLSAANWAGFGLHPRGNFEAFTQAASKQKWLEAHPGRHEEWFYLDRGMELQKRFLDHFLKGVDNGWDREPPVLLNLRRPFSTEFEARKEIGWPLPSTKWTSIYLSALEKVLSWSPPAYPNEITFDALGTPITFISSPLENETELTGPLSAKIFVSSSTTDADLFLTLQAFSPEGKEVEFQGTVDPHTPLAQGWLRASHRKLDLTRSTPYRPYHSHDEIQPLKPGTIYELDVEIWPTCIILPPGFCLALQVSGHDFERPPSDDPNEAWMSRGSGPWLHTNQIDRPASIFGGKTTIHTGPGALSSLTLPIIEPH